MSNRWPISRSGLPVVAGLKPVKSESTILQRLAYDQSEKTIFDKLANIVKLEKTDGLEGFDLFQARCRNLVAMYWNPFATGETIKQAFVNGVLV